jgi:prevent-host-death family protein
MATKFNIHEAKTQFSKLIERTEAGEDIVVARAGKPVVRLVKIEEPPRHVDRRPGRLAHLAGTIPDDIWFEPMSEDELALWEGGAPGAAE